MGEGLSGRIFPTFYPNGREDKRYYGNASKKHD
jgi:hypothetical protein